MTTVHVQVRAAPGTAAAAGADAAAGDAPTLSAPVPNAAPVAAAAAAAVHAPIGLLAAGFALDAYDLFAVNGVLVIWSLSPDTDPNGTEKSLLTAVALLGAVIGQVLFGVAGDVCGHGRPFVITLALMLCGTLVSASLPTSNHTALFGALIAARLVMGIGIGGEYPLSVVISSRLHLKPGESKAHVLASVFALQGVGIAAAVCICYALFVTCSHDVAWRVALGLGAAFSLALAAFRFHYLRDIICGTTPGAGTAAAAHDQSPSRRVRPAAVAGDGAAPAPAPSSSCGCMHALTFACGCLCSRLHRLGVLGDSPTAHSAGVQLQVMPVAGGAGSADADSAHSAGLHPAGPGAIPPHVHDDPHHPDHPQHQPLTAAEAHGHKVGCGRLWAVLAGNAVVRRRLIGTCVNWFLLDVVFYANGLFSATLLTHFTQNDPELTLRYNLYLGLIGLPGYVFALFVISQRAISRRAHQTVSFALLGLMYLVCAFQTDAMQRDFRLLLVLYGLTFFLSNAGPNTTTYVLSGESFAPAIRTSCSGLSAAAGKIGAAVSAYGMAPLAAYSLQAVFVTCGCISFVGAVTSFALTASQPELDALNPAPRPRLPASPSSRPASVVAVAAGP